MRKIIFFALFCMMSITFFSCNEEGNDDPIELRHRHQSFKMGKVKFHEMLSHLHQVNRGVLPQYLKPSSNRGDNSYITEIDSSNITQIVYEDVTSFTLHINTTDDGLYSYSNLVIKSYNGHIEEFIYHYNPTSEWQNAFDNGERIDYEGELVVTDIFGNGVNLNNNIANRVGGGSDNCTIAFDVACYGSSCPCTDGNGQTFYVTVSCPSGGGGEPGTGTGSGYNGPINPGGYPPTEPNPGGGGNNSDFDYFIMDLSNNQKNWLLSNPVTMGHVYTFLENNNYNYNAYQVALEFVEFLEAENGIKEKLRQAIANGITTTAEYTHKVFKKFSEFTNQYPNSIYLINTTLSGVRYGISDLVDTNPNTCTFVDLFNMWLFELGSHPINFNGIKVSTNQLKIQEGVNQARDIAIQQIQNNNLNTINHSWTYGQNEFYDGMQGGNFVTSFLGSYSTKITIIANSNGYQLNFHVYNTSSWDSATRLRIDNDGDGIHDGVFPNTYRNISSDISLGGNFTQNWYWTEIVN